jgi:hypothetical protein
MERDSSVRIVTRRCARQLLLLLLALQPSVGFGLSNNTSPFFPIYYQLSPSSHSQHLQISCAGQHTKQISIAGKGFILDDFRKKWLLDFFSRRGGGEGVKQTPGSGVDRECPPGAEVNNAWSHTSTLSCPFLEWRLTNYKEKLCFTFSCQSMNDSL